MARAGGAAAPPALTALASRSHCDPATEAFLAGLSIGDRRSAGSSLKFCVIAEGGGDLYPRFGPTMEWDTAAGDAVLRAAGGATLSLEGGPLLYGKVAAGLRNGGFVAWAIRDARHGRPVIVHEPSIGRSDSRSWRFAITPSTICRKASADAVRGLRWQEME